jgi:hypothetical protein
MSEDNEYGRFRKGEPDVLEKSDAEYKLEEALREVERLQGNALGTLKALSQQEVTNLLDPVASLCVYTIGLKAQLSLLQNKIRWHQNQWLSGDNKCWKDNEELYKLLPEGYTPPQRDTLCELENCKRYIESCHDPKVKYVSPQVRIQELEELVDHFRTGSAHYEHFYRVEWLAGHEKDNKVRELEKQLLEMKLRAELAERILEVNKVTHF